MHTIRNLIRRSLFLSLVVAGGSYACSHIQVEEIPVTANPSEEIDKLAAARSEAVSTQVDVLSPEHFQDGEDALKRAEQSRAEGEDTKVIFRHVAEGNAYMAKAVEVAEVSRSSLEPVVAARADALEAGAPKFMAKDFAEADESLKDTTRTIENGDLSVAETARSPLAKRYADLELKAIKVDSLAAAKATILKAEKEGAKENASRTYKQAQQALTDADAFITANRHDKAGIAKLSKVATANADRLLNISRQVKVVGKSDPEGAVLERERQKGMLDAESTANATKTAELGAANAASRVLEGQNSEMAAEQAGDARLDAAKAQFTSSEADVYRDGNRLIIRMKTIAFPSGTSTLSPATFPVLGKVQRVIRELGASHVTVEGHTDTVGSAATNAKLSKERATAIGSYLASNGYDAGNISTVGYGASKPLASNATAAGRTQNRRVDVIIEPQLLH